MYGFFQKGASRYENLNLLCYESRSKSWIFNLEYDYNSLNLWLSNTV